MQIHISPVSKPSDLATVKKIRHCHQSSVFDNHDSEIERQRDLFGVVVLAFHEDIPVATCRLVQTGSDLTLVEHIANIRDSFVITEAWEVERFVVSKNFRGLRNVMSIYKAIAAWLNEKKEIRLIVAVCNRRVAALLHRTGLEVIADNVRIDDDHTGYLLLGATVDDICKRIL